MSTRKIESVSVADVMTLAEQSRPEHLFWAFQVALEHLIDSHHEKAHVDLPVCLASLRRALVNGPGWMQAAQPDDREVNE